MYICTLQYHFSYKFFRGNRKSYYDEDFIVSNEKVDTHIADIGYASDVCEVHRLCPIMWCLCIGSNKQFVWHN